MDESVEEHIARRKQRAEEAMQDEGPVGRARIHAGVAAANGIDRATPTAARSVLAFIEGAIEGGLKGGTLGLVAGLVIVGLGASAAGGLIYGAMAIGALAFGATQAIKSVQEYQDKIRYGFSDRIAESAGVNPGPSAEEEKAQNAEARRKYYENEEAIYGPPRYAQDERRRRANREHEGHRHGR